MALYDGFFDAVLNEETGEFDRAYGSGDFTGYFANLIGSGVCVYKNPDSFKVRFENEAAVVSPGYLFIEGYWLKNDEDYTISVTGDATLAIVAHLNIGKRMIELEAVSTAESYPDSLVLALVDPAAGTAEDTRRNTEICGVIEPAGELAKKVEWAVNYIDNEIEDKLAAAEAAISEQSKKLDDKIAEVQAQINKIAPPPVGTIKFSAAQDMGPDWLPCNGDFITEDQYPDLVAALGKLTPSGDKFKLISDGEIAPQISNGVIYNGRMWVYSFSAKKLYGVDLNGTGAIKEISITSTDNNFKNFQGPSKGHPLALSIIPVKTIPGKYKICLAQSFDGGITIDQTYASYYPKYHAGAALVFWADFEENKTSISMTAPFGSFDPEIKFSNDTRFIGNSSASAIPYVVSSVINGEDVFYYLPYGITVYPLGHISNYAQTFLGVISWKLNSTKDSYATIESIPSVTVGSSTPHSSTLINGFNKKNKDELIVFTWTDTNGQYHDYSISSYPSHTFNVPKVSTKPKKKSDEITSTILAGNNGFLVQCGADLQKIYMCDNAISNGIEGINTELSGLPSAKRVFPDGASYLWGKDIYMIFVGTGIIFSRTLEEGSFGYLDTTSVLGTITQFGYLDYSQDEGTLYLLGQDTSNRVKVAKIVLNTLYDYANNGAWLPMIVADGVPAYIKAVKSEGEEVPPDVPPDGYSFNLTTSTAGNVSGGATFTGLFSATINGINITSGRKTFTDPIVNFKMTATSEYTNQSQYTFRFIIYASYRKDGESHSDSIVGMTIGPNKSITIGESADANVDISAFNGLDVEIVFTTNV